MTILVIIEIYMLKTPPAPIPKELMGLDLLKEVLGEMQYKISHFGLNNVDDLKEGESTKSQLLGKNYFDWIK